MTSADHFVHVKRHVGRQHLTFTSCSVQAKGDAGTAVMIISKLCVQAMANAGSLWPKSTERCETRRCERSMTNVIWLMQLFADVAYSKSTCLS